MDIVKFLDQTWQEIPEQDNPAMGHIRTSEGLVNQECIMVFKGSYPLISNGGFVVAENPLHGDIIKKGVFWNAEIAGFFAEALANNHCMCPACKDGVIHDSDCAVHNMPAYPNGECDCSVSE